MEKYVRAEIDVIYFDSDVILTSENGVGEFESRGGIFG